jgi:diguanylate cyclase (GGDEF)-like protein
MSAFEPAAQALLDALEARAAVVSDSGDVIAVNHLWRSAELPDYESEMSIEVGDNIFRVLANVRGPRQAYARRMIEGIRSVLEGRVEQLDFEDTDRTMMTRWFRQRVVRLNGVGALITHRDITEQVLSELELMRQATRDGLTGLANRVSLLDRLNQYVSQRRRDVGVVWLDIDRFAAINDAVGSMEADEMLVSLANRLSGVTQNSEFLGRLSGDTFVVIALGVRSEHQLVRIARRLQDSLIEPFVVDNRSLTLTASAGVALVSREHRVGDDVLRDAGAALVQAKGMGRNAIGFVDAERRTQQQTRLALEQDLRLAIGRNELEVKFQPEWSLLSARVVGAEALVRWEHPTRGALSPNQFIPIAEETGDIVMLGAWVLDRAIEIASGWPIIDGEGPFVAVNLSVVQLADPNLLTTVRMSLERWGLDPKRLVLEITETAVVDRLDLAMAILQQLRDLGVRIALDDFGTGYSSLGILRTLPVDVLKLDKAFIDPLGREPVTREIVNAVLALARSLKMEVVAEGVESAEQQQVLKELGCHLIQGFAISPPQSASELRFTRA